MDLDLRGIDLFKDFSDEELERFRPFLEQIDMEPGTLLFKEGDPGDSLYIVMCGNIRIFKKIAGSDNAEKSLALLEPGMSLGEMTLLDGAERSAGARAETHATVLKLTRESFFNVLRTFPPAGARLFSAFMRSLSQRLRQADEELVVLYEVGKIIGAAPPLQELLKKLLEHVMAGTKAGFGVFFYLNDISGKLEVKEAIGPGFEDILDLQTKVTEGIVGAAISKNKVITTNDLESDAELASQKRFGYERKCMMIAPLTRQDTPFGAILVANPCDACTFTGADLNLLQAVASQAAAAVEASLFKSDSDAKAKYDRHFFQF